MTLTPAVIKSIRDTAICVKDLHDREAQTLRQLRGLETELNRIRSNTIRKNKELIELIDVNTGTSTGTTVIELICALCADQTVDAVEVEA